MKDIKIKSKIPVGILGATGSVGQKFVELLTDHPWFEIVALAASEKSVGPTYKETVNWLRKTPLCDKIGEMTIQACKPDLPCKVVFSSLDAKVAGDIEKVFAKAGYIVISNAKNHRMDDNVPLVVPEINSDHLNLLSTQSFGDGKIVTNPNCSTIGLVMALKPLLDKFGLKAVNVVTMQALSGAGFPGVSSLEIIDNVIPFISGEEEKIELEPHKIFGTYRNGSIIYHEIPISAQCNRVAVLDGHLESVSVKLNKPVPSEGSCGKLRDEIINSWVEFIGEPQQLNLPTAPKQPIHYFKEDNSPQPKLHRDLEGGMAVSIGRLRRCNVLDYKFTVLSHNTVRGAAGGSILIAELMVAKGIIPRA